MRVGIDIGGTFTDLVFLGVDGEVKRAKVLSTPDDYGQGILDGRMKAMGMEGADPAKVFAEIRTRKDKF